ncbi:MAG: hypothetical protein WC846_00335 [Candidatus Gracilibacteria bacterium]|jgi:hypothetical protein
MSKKIIISLTLLVSIILSGCGTPATDTPATDTPDTTPPPATVTTNEDWDLMDIKAQEVTWTEGKSTGAIGRFYTTKIENPATGIKIATYLLTPKTGSGPFKTVVIIPGTTNSGIETLSEQKEQIQNTIDKGIAVVLFDIDGRGNNEGTENLNGFDAQDGLMAISLTVAKNPLVNKDQMGLISLSYGVAMGSGMVARYANTQPFLWYMDWEGPVDRYGITGNCGENASTKNFKAQLKKSKSNLKAGDHLCSEDDFWSEREAVTFLAKVEIPYQRIQGEIDHGGNPDNSKSITAVNAAINGISPWVRLNSEEPNKTFDYDAPPTYIEGSTSITKIPAYAAELFELFPSI